MEQVTVRVPASQLDRVDEQVDRGDYASRSEWVRHAIREQLTEGRR
jgi:Arc/MetJ-type ribon-helix-helix transcriptional regulator